MKECNAKMIIVEGNISAGKSTLSRDLGEMMGYKVFLEPTNTNPYLTNFYKDPKQWVMPMQLWLLRQRFRTYVAAMDYILKTGQGVILDRSVFSDWVFAQNSALDGTMSPEGFAYYSELRNKMLEGLPVPNITVYLDVSAELCYDRVHQVRCRGCESGIPLEYLQGLDTCYNMFLKNMKVSGSKVLQLDWREFGLGNVQGVMNAISAVEFNSTHWAKATKNFVDMMQTPRSIHNRMIADECAAFDDEMNVNDEFICDSTVEESYNPPPSPQPSIHSEPNSPKTPVGAAQKVSQRTPPQAQAVEA